MFVLSLIIVMLFALSVAYFAIQNTVGVTLVVMNNTIANVPLYFVIISSIVLGVLLASVISSLNAFEAYRKMRGKDKVIEKDQNAIADLEAKVQSLEYENAELRNADHEHQIETQEKPKFTQSILGSKRESKV